MIACRHHQEGPLIEKMDILVALVMIIIYDNNYTKLFLISSCTFYHQNLDLSICRQHHRSLSLRKNLIYKIKPKGQPVI
jgi:hypothetical protein